MRDSLSHPRRKNRASLKALGGPTHALLFGWLNEEPQPSAELLYCQSLFGAARARHGPATLAVLPLQTWLLYPVRSNSGRLKDQEA